jgi:SOS-response transcriptional repressor LexA
MGVAAQGLKDGMLVVVKGNERLRDGQLVSVDKRG